MCVCVCVQKEGLGQVYPRRIPGEVSPLQAQATHSLLHVAYHCECEDLCADFFRRSGVHAIQVSPCFSSPAPYMPLLSLIRDERERLQSPQQAEALFLF